MERLGFYNTWHRRRSAWRPRDDYLTCAYSPSWRMDLRHGHWQRSKRRDVKWLKEQWKDACLEWRGETAFEMTKSEEELEYKKSCWQQDFWNGDGQVMWQEEMTIDGRQDWQAGTQETEEEDVEDRRKDGVTNSQETGWQRPKIDEIGFKWRGRPFIGQRSTKANDDDESGVRWSATKYISCGRSVDSLSNTTHTVNSPDF